MCACRSSGRETTGLARWKLCLGNVSRARDVRRLLVFLGRGDVVALTLPFSGDRHELRTHPAGLAFVADVSQRHRGVAQQADRSGATHRAFARNTVRATDLKADALSVRDRDDVSSLPFFLPSQNDLTSGIVPAQAGFGHVTVRAQIQAMTVRSDAGDLTFGYRCPIRFSASSRIHLPYRRTSSARPVAPGQDIRSPAAPGKTGACPAHFGGISISALLMSTATGFRSDACASSPSRCASKRDRPAAGERVQDRRRVPAG